MSAIPVHPYIKYLHGNPKHHDEEHRSHSHSYLKHRDAHKGHHPGHQPPPPPPPPHGAWTVPDLCASYQWPSGLPGGGIIGIIELGGGWNQADVDQAFKAMGQPSPSIVDISVDGTTNNSPGSDADGEVALDIQVSGGAYYVATGAPASIHMYWGTDIGACVAKAAADGCATISISWGADEANWGRDAADAMESTAQAAVADGALIFAASGDNDSGDGGPTPANVDLPASAPSIIGCGGTSKPQQGTEVVWNNDPGKSNGEGTGGGYSTLFPAMSWQVGIPPAPNGLGRMVPDVSANADPDTGYVIYLDGQQQIVGGTSAVAPLYAGLFAAMGPPVQGRGLVTPKFYQNPSWFNDITQGDNGTYHAASGPDACTGMGSPVGKEMVNALAAAPVS